MSRHRASSMVNIYGLNYCADHTNGNIYEYSLDIYSDNGDPIIKERDTAVIHSGLFGVPDEKLFYNEVEFIIVSGTVDVSGTGRGPQAPTTVVPLTNCNEVWEYGTLVPDLHVSGQDETGVWTGGMITGTGVLTDDHGSELIIPNSSGNYDRAGIGAITALGLIGCQEYIAVGPYSENGIVGQNIILSVGGGTGSSALDQVSIDGVPNLAGTLTDSGVGDNYYRHTLGSTNKTSFLESPMVFRVLVKKDTAATNWSAFYLTCNPTVAVGSPNYITSYFNQATGEINVYDSVGRSPEVDVVDRGDWWEVYTSIYIHNTGISGVGELTECVADIYPAISSDGISPDASVTGSLVVGACWIYRYRNIGECRGGPIYYSIFAGAYVMRETEAYIDILNHDNTEGGYYIEWRPQYSLSELALHDLDIEILSLNSTSGLLYYDRSAAQLVSTDGTNTATVPLTIVADTKYRLGVVWGDHLRVGVDGAWSTEQPYDGAFPTGSRFDIFRPTVNYNPPSYWRELRGFRTDYLTAYNEINRLMAGSSA